MASMLLASVLFVTSCTKEVEEPGGGGGTASSIMFWSNQSGSNITVKISGGTYTGVVNKYYSGNTSSNPPSCSSTGCYTESLTSGTSYNYTATDGTHNWSGSFSLSGGCKTLLLYW